MKFTIVAFFVYTLSLYGSASVLAGNSGFEKTPELRSLHTVPSVSSVFARRGHQLGYPRPHFMMRKVKKSEPDSDPGKRSVESFSGDNEGKEDNEDNEDEDNEDCDDDSEECDADEADDYASTAYNEIQALFEKISGVHGSHLQDSALVETVPKQASSPILETPQQSEPETASHSPSSVNAQADVKTTNESLPAKSKAKAVTKPSAINDETESDANQSNSGSTYSHGLLPEKDYKCPCKDPHATKEHPNGSIDFLNCGINSGGWKPPNVGISDLVMASPEQVASNPTFRPCQKYTDIFKEAAEKNGLPPMLVMSFAMQESNCNANLRGPNGEIGIMQLSPDKCANDPCWDPSKNIEKGAAYFRSLLDASNGNAIQAIGSYNGWEVGMTMEQATSKKYGCAAQRNLDYLFQTLSGFCQGKDGYSGAFNVYDNLKKC